MPAPPSRRRGRPRPPPDCAPPRPACRRRSCGPRAARSPARPASASVVTACSIQITVRSSSSRRRCTSRAIASISLSTRPAATSSSSSTRGRVASAMPISSRRCCDGVIAAAGSAACASSPSRARMLASSCSSAGAGAPAPGEAQAEGDVRRHAQRGEDPRRLEGAGDAVLREAVRRRAGEALAEREQLARGRRHHAREGVEEGGLAGAVRADDADQLARARTRR